MQRLTTTPELRAWRRGAGAPVGLVPTMGYLHEGHLALAARDQRGETTARATAAVHLCAAG